MDEFGKDAKSLKKIFLSFILFLATLSFYPAVTDAAGAMKVHYINVGQGDAIYIKAPNGEDILIDAGKNGKTVVDYLKKQKVNDIEIMIATHPDADHIGGLDEVLNAFKVKQVYAPKVSHTTQAYKDFLTAVKKKKLTIKSATKGTTLPVKGVTAKFVGPTKTYGTNDLNNWSAVLHMTYGKKSFLFVGDAETKAETDMINAKQTLKADVLKVGHHGAKTSTSANFLKQVKPTYAVISVGKNNYGHPTSNVINNLKNAKANVYRTDKQGTIIATTNGSTISFNVKPATSATAAKTTATTAMKLTVSLDNVKPKQYSTINLMVKGLPAGTKYTAVFKYKSTTSTYSGKVGTKLPVKISRAAVGVKVPVTITATYNGKKYTTQTAFTPQKK